MFPQLTPRPGRSILIAAAVAFGLALTCPSADDKRAAKAKPHCPLTQSWSAGNAYDWEELFFHRSGKATWTLGDRKGTVDQHNFRWRTTGPNKLTITWRGQDYPVQIRIVPDRHDCELSLQGLPFNTAGTLYGKPRRALCR